MVWFHAEVSFIFLYNSSKGSKTITADFQSDIPVPPQVFTVSINFTPFTFLFLVVYSSLLFCLLSVQDFFSIWILIELLILVFLGISYTVLSFRFSSVMQYFLIQTLASFSIFVFYFLSSSIPLTLSFLLKLSMFPFHSWFLSLMVRFPNSLLFLSSTFHKLPPFYLIVASLSSLSLKLLLVSSLFSLLISGLVIVVLSDIRFLLVSSSVGNNSWLYLSLLQGFHTFSLFFLVYTFSLFFAISFFRSSSRVAASPGILIYLSFLSLSGFPPFPLFFIKAYVIFLSMSLSYIIVVLLIFSALVLVSYIRSLFHFATFHFATFRSFLLFWWVSLCKNFSLQN